MNISVVNVNCYKLYELLVDTFFTRPEIFSFPAILLNILATKMPITYGIIGTGWITDSCKYFREGIARAVERWMYYIEKSLL